MKVIRQLTGLPPKLAEKAIIITLNFEALYSHLVSWIRTWTSIGIVILQIKYKLLPNTT